MPTIIAFLGYNRLPTPRSLVERLVRQRTALGMSQKEAAWKIGVHRKCQAGGGSLQGDFRVASIYPRGGPYSDRKDGQSW